MDMQAAAAVRQDADQLLDDVAALERSSRAGVTIANASDDHAETQYSGIFYVLAPQGQPGDSIVIGDRLEWQRATGVGGIVSGAVLFNKPRFIPEKGDATSIARQLLAEERLGQRGCYLVRGDDQDEARRDRARQRWIEWKTEMCREGQREWIQKMERIVKSGERLPIQSAATKRQIEFLARVDAGEFSANAVSKRWVSLIDAADFDTEAEALAYNVDRYRDRVASDPDSYVRDTIQSHGAAPEPVPVAPVPVPSARIGKGKRSMVVPKLAEEPLDPEYVLERAEQLGVHVKPSETKKILAGDADVMQAVLNRVVTKAKVENA